MRLLHAIPDTSSCYANMIWEQEPGRYLRLELNTHWQEIGICWGKKVVNPNGKRWTVNDRETFTSIKFDSLPELWQAWGQASLDPSNLLLEVIL